MVNRLLFADHVVLLESSEQSFLHAVDQFSAACDKTAMNISTRKIEVLCLSRNRSECMLKVSSNTLQQDEKFHLGGGSYSQVTESKIRRLTHRLVKQTQYP